MTTQELIDYYVALLIIQYATQQNAAGTIAALCGLLIQDQIISQIGNGFVFTVTPPGQPLDGAAGVQLEAIASYRGAQRVVYGLAPQIYFEMDDALSPSSDVNGFIDALDLPTPVSWIFLTGQDTQQPIYSLTDDQLYRLTQLRAQVQRSDCSVSDIDRILFEFFTTNVVLFDNLNMTMVYVHLASDPDPLFPIAAITQSLPAPAGVLVQAFSADLTSDFFGLQDAGTYDSAFVGFSDALLALTTGTFVTAP